MPSFKRENTNQNTQRGLRSSQNLPAQMTELQSCLLQDIGGLGAAAYSPVRDLLGLNCLTCSSFIFYLKSAEDGVKRLNKLFTSVLDSCWIHKHE